MKVDTNSVPVGSSCVECGKDINPDDFRDTFSKMNFVATSLCQDCQDEEDEDCCHYEP